MFFIIKKSQNVRYGSRTKKFVNKSGSKHAADSALTSETPAGWDNESCGSITPNTKGWSHLLTVGSTPTCAKCSPSCG